MTCVAIATLAVHPCPLSFIESYYSNTSIIIIANGMNVKTRRQTITPDTTNATRCP